MLPSLFNTSTVVKPQYKSSFFVRRWPQLRHLKNSIEREEVLQEAWDEFIHEKRFFELPELVAMVRSFLLAIPSVQYLLGKIPDTLIMNTLNRHTETMVSRLVGEESERMEVKMDFNDFQAAFSCMFVISEIERERAQVDADSTLHGLEQLDKSLEPYSNMSIMGQHADMVENVVIGILRKTPSQRLFQEVEFLIQLVKESFLKYNLSSHQMREIFRHLKLKCIPAGSYLCHEGDPGKEFYVLFHGLIGVRKKTNSKAQSYESEISETISGTAFGELSLMTKNGIRHAALVAKRDCVLGILDEHDFRHLMMPFVGKVQKEKRCYFEKLPSLVQAPPRVIFDLSYSARIQTFPPCTIIWHQQDPFPTMVLFIKSGHIRAVRELLPIAEARPSVERQQAKVSIESRGLSAQEHDAFETAELRRKSEMFAAADMEAMENVLIAPSTQSRLSRATTLTPSQSRTPSISRAKSTRVSNGSNFLPELHAITNANASEAQTARPIPTKQKSIFADCAILGPWSAIGHLGSDGKTRTLIPVTFIAVDHVIVFEVSVFDLKRSLDTYAHNLLSRNLFRCPHDSDIRKLLRLDVIWNNYRKRIRNCRGQRTDFHAPKYTNPYMLAALYADD